MRGVSWLTRMAWVLTWFCVAMIPATSITTCTMGSDDAWLVHLLFWSPLFALLLVLIQLTHRHHARWLWLASPHILLVPWALIFAWPFLSDNTFGAQHLCAILKSEAGFNEYPASWWQPIWAPVQYALLLCLTACMLSSLRKRNAKSAS